MANLSFLRGSSLNSTTPIIKDGQIIFDGSGYLAWDMDTFSRIGDNSVFNSLSLTFDDSGQGYTQTGYINNIVLNLSQSNYQIKWHNNNSIILIAKFVPVADIKALYTSLSSTFDDNQMLFTLGDINNNHCPIMLIAGTKSGTQRFIAISSAPIGTYNVTIQDDLVFTQQRVFLRAKNADYSNESYADAEGNVIHQSYLNKLITNDQSLNSKLNFVKNGSNIIELNLDDYSKFNNGILLEHFTESYVSDNNIADYEAVPYWYVKSNGVVIKRYDPEEVL